MEELSNRHWDHIMVHRGFDEIRDIYECIGERGYIGGSYAAYMSSRLEKFTANDVDIFAVSNEAATALCDDMHVKLGYWISGANDVAWSFYKPERLPVQIVRPHPEWSTFPDDILNSFDMNVCRGVLIAPDKLLGDIDLGLTHGKLLRMHNPLRTLKRVMKYEKRGIEFNDHELLKLFRAWQELPDQQKQVYLDLAYAGAFPSGSNEADYEDWYDDDDDWFEGE